MTERILIVDDHPLTRDALATLLGGNGFDVVGVASGGAEAVAGAALLQPDVVLLDLQVLVASDSEGEVLTDLHAREQLFQVRGDNVLTVGETDKFPPGVVAGLAARGIALSSGGGGRYGPMIVQNRPM